MRIRAPAKINLFLRVGAKRADGYHPIASWMCRIGLWDELVFKAATGSALEVTCNRDDLDCGPGNLIRRAAELLGQAALQKSMQTPPAAIALSKRIPIGAGLGGGSSDAAHTLLALNQFWDLNLPQKELLEIAGRLGSDVPFFLGAASALCTGRGEVLTSMDTPWARGCLLIVPPYPLSTAAVYGQFDRLDPPGHPQCDLPGLIDNWKSLPARGLMQFLYNDLEPAAFAIRPELGHLRDEVERSIGRPVRMSGSGSTLFTLTDTLDEARMMAHRITQDYGFRSLGAELCPA